MRAFLLHAQDHTLTNLFVMVVVTGMRQGELLALKWTDVDLENRSVFIRSTLGYKHGKPAILPPKSEQSRRTLHLSNDSIAALKA